MAISKDDFKAAMGAFASGVTVVTTVDPQGRKWGITVNAFSSLSMEPPLCLICIDNRAGSVDALKAAEAFAVNILGADQQEVSDRFASRIDDKFEGIVHDAGSATGCPLIKGALVTVECDVRDITDGGDHQIFIGTIKSVHVGDGQPLVYWRGGYRAITSS